MQQQQARGSRRPDSSLSNKTSTLLFDLRRGKVFSLSPLLTSLLDPEELSVEATIQ